MSKQTIIKIGIGIVAIVSVICVIALVGNKKDNNEPTEDNNGIIIGVGDNNNDNTNDKITADDKDNDKDTSTEESTTEVSKEVIESTSSIAGNWASLMGDAMEFIPARGNEASIYIPRKNIFYKGTYETDDKTYIKVNYVDTSDSEKTGTMEFKIVSLAIDSDGKLQLRITDSDNIEYVMWPAS